MEKEKMMKLRYEIKYLINRNVKLALLCDLSAFFASDSQYANNGQSYQVSSLYFETPDYKIYHQKMYGLDYRKKYRIRIYNNNFAKIVLEKKEKYGALIAKSQLDISPQDYELLIANNVSISKNSSKHWQNFVYDKTRFNLCPVVQINYHRYPLKPLNSVTEVRVTIDEGVTVHGAHSFSNDRRKFDIIPHGYSILELKFKQSLPYGLQQIIKKYRLENAAISKFCFGIRTLAEANLLRSF